MCSSDLRERIWGRNGVRGVCNGREERERGREAVEEREREKTGEKNKVGPATVINWDPKKI